MVSNLIALGKFNQLSGLIQSQVRLNTSTLLVWLPVVSRWPGAYFQKGCLNQGLVH